ncbi:MAG TPA: hypothetical protein VMT16_12065, partial [Thermoanaerobaculia bacterium]|nr:hypothetical protein [Thermoanaerobaculia bacterium]
MPRNSERPDEPGAGTPVIPAEEPPAAESPVGDRREDELEAAVDRLAREAASEDALLRGTGLQPKRLLGFYDGLRVRVTRTVEQRAGRLGQRTVEVLLLVPDMFILLVRLLLDPEVPKSSKTLIGGALAY